ncbi:MAG TPA: hypothetical protein VGN07_00855 [Steroidobacteraceae bacterium]|jgi:hypothetical protein
MPIKSDQISFNSFEGSGPRTATQDVLFDAPVSQAVAILTGFNAAFTPNDDHHLGNLEVRVNAAIDALVPQRVTVTATFGLRDWSNEWDDKYEGTVDFAVFAT